MSHNPNPNADTSGFNFPSAAGVRANVDRVSIGIAPTVNDSITESSSSSAIRYTVPDSQYSKGLANDPNLGN